jgi:hypothetical protein
VAKIGVLGALIALAAATAVSAAEAPLTIASDHRVVGFGTGTGSLTLSGRLATGRDGEPITVEASECGSPGWRLIATDRTAPGGSWHAGAAPTLRTSYRARWRDAVTSPVEVLVRPAVRLDQRSRTKFGVLTIASRFFRGARGRFERFDRARGWLLVRRVTLSRGSAPRGAPWAYSGAEFSARVPARALVRFVLPRDQTGPCYLAGQSIQFNVR